MRSNPNLEPRAVLLRSLLDDEGGHDDGLNESPVLLVVDDQSTSAASLGVGEGLHLSDDSAGVIDELRAVLPREFAAVLGEVSAAGGLVVVDMGIAIAGSEHADIGGTGLRGARAGVGDEGAVFVAAVYLELRVVGLAVVEDFAGLRILAEAVEGVARAAGVADEVEGKRHFV